MVESRLTQMRHVTWHSACQCKMLHSVQSVVLLAQCGTQFSRLRRHAMRFSAKCRVEAVASDTHLIGIRLA